MTVPWKEDDQIVGEATYEGTIHQVKERLPNGQIEKALILSLDRPACLPARSADPQTDGIHIYGSDSQIHRRLVSLIGKHVTVTGEGFAAMTAHHHRPIVVDIKSVSSK